MKANVHIFKSKDSRSRCLYAHVKKPRQGKATEMPYEIRCFFPNLQKIYRKLIGPSKTIEKPNKTEITKVVFNL